MKTTAFDYSAAAELFTFCRRRLGGRGLSFRRYDKALDAIRYAVEDLPRIGFPGTMMEVNGARYHHVEIRALYDSADYPLRRKAREADNAEDS